MGQPLTGNKIKDTYPGLLKTSSSAQLPGGSLESISDGLGNDSGLQLGQSAAKLTGNYIQIESANGLSGIVADAGTPSSADINYYGTHSFQSATVEGLPFESDYRISASNNGSGATVDITAYPSETITSSIQLLAGSNVTIDTVDNIMTINATGGGGGGATVSGPGTSLPWRSRSAGDVWITPYQLYGYGQTTGQSLDNPNQLHFVPFFAVPGKSLKNAFFVVNTGQAGALMNVGLYKATEISGVLYPTYVTTLASDIDVSSGGNKTMFTNQSFTLPTDTAYGMYFIAFQTSVGGVALRRWSEPVAWGQIAYEIYRDNAVRFQASSFALPTGTIDNDNTGWNDGTTDGTFCWYFQYN